nr:amino acid adenylation domain-containing protein [Williamsia sp. 1135]
MYTSGTTGKPKGVTISHQAIGNRLKWMQSEYGLDGADRVLQKTPFSFDVSVWEFFWPLMSGAAMIVAAPEGHKDPQYLTTLISERQITTVHFVPSMLAAFLDSGPAPAQLASVKRVFTSGEALSAQNASAAMAVFSGGVHNLYGPTEAAVDVTYQPIETDHTANPAVSGVPIGVPVANTDVFVLDHHLRLVPPGVPGELYLGGVQLARGYHDRPALTADRFVANLHAPSSEAGARMYRTGDLARWNADGRLEYLGRNDFQVKVRGFRIELGEVEAALASVDGVHAAVVVASTELGTTRLLGYVTPTRDVDTIDGMTVLEQAGLVLPSHMVPTTVTVLEAFPLTANGKLDRSALPEPSVQVRAEEQRAPTTESEKVLCEIYADVLGVGAVGVDDDFFALGGDSILSISVVRRAGQRGIGLKVHHLFDLRTPARTAALVDEGPPAESEVLDLPHRETSMTPIMHRQLAGAASPDTVRQIRIVLAPDETDLDRLRAALASVVVRHPALRMSIDTANDPRVRFVDEKVGQSSVTRLDARGVAEEDLAELIMDSEVRHSADISLAQGILTNIMYVERDAEQDLLVWTVNHFAVDFVSWHVLVDDLRASYLGDDLTPRRESSYATWMEHLNSESTLEQFRGELSYWQGQLASATPVLESIDRTGSAVPGTGRVDATIAPAVGEQLFVGAGRIGTSLQDVLIATLVVALQRWRTRRGGPPAERMLVEFEGHGRPTALDDRLEVTQTVGWFTSMYPLAIPVSSDTAEAISAVPAAAADVVHAVADVVGDVPDQGVGYGVLTSLDAQSVPELAGLAEPDVLFNFAGVLGDFERENRAVAWETPPQSPAVISGRTDDSEHSHPITVDLHAVRSLAGTAVHYVIAGELSDDDFAEMSRYWQQAASEMAAGLDVVADSAGERAATPTAVVPLPTAHRIRTGGADLASAWYSEVIDVRSDLDIAELRAFLYSATRSIDSLRTRVEPRSSSIWWIDTVPPSPRAISERVTALDMSRLPRAEAIAAAAVELSDQIDVTAGQGLAAALVDSAVGRSVVVVAHALCIDRVGLHALAARIHDCTGPSAHPLVSDEFVSIADAAAAVDTFAEVRSEDDAGSRCLAALLDSERTSVEAASGTHAVSTVIDGLLDPLLVEEAFIRAARNTLGPVGIDREFDLRAVVTVPGTVEGPLTATYPQELSEGEFTGDDRAFFSLTRHAARTRRKLRSIAQESVLLTRVHGEPATLHGREGLEHLYPVVCRYFCGDSTITVVVIGVQQEIAEQVVDTWKQEIRFGQREIR